MPRIVALEVLDLLNDVDGEADEDVLDDAAQVLRRAPQFDGTVRARLRSGEWVAVELSSDERATLLECIVDWDAKAGSEQIRKVVRRFNTALRAQRRDD